MCIASIYIGGPPGDQTIEVIPTRSFYPPGFVLLLAGDFVPQLKMGETKSRLGPNKVFCWRPACISPKRSSGVILLGNRRSLKMVMRCNEAFIMKGAII